MDPSICLYIQNERNINTSLYLHSFPITITIINNS